MVKVVINGWDTGLKTISLIKLIHAEAGMTLSQARDCKTSIVDGNTVEFNFMNAERATFFLEQAKRLGAIGYLATDPDNADIAGSDL